MAHRQVVLLLEHDLGRHGIVGTVRFIDGELFLLLFHIEMLDCRRIQ